MRIPLISRMLENRRLNDEILVLFALRFENWVYQYPTLWDTALNKPRRLQSAIDRLSNKGLIQSKYADDEGILPHKMYRITPKGKALILEGQIRQRYEDELSRRHS